MEFVIAIASGRVGWGSFGNVYGNVVLYPHNNLPSLLKSQSQRMLTLINSKEWSSGRLFLSLHFYLEPFIHTPKWNKYLTLCSYSRGSPGRLTDGFLEGRQEVHKTSEMLFIPVYCLGEWIQVYLFFFF